MQWESIFCPRCGRFAVLPLEVKVVAVTTERVAGNCSMLSDDDRTCGEDMAR